MLYKITTGWHCPWQQFLKSLFNLLTTFHGYLTDFIIILCCFFLFTALAVETSTASHRCNGAGYVEDGLHKTSNTVASYIVTQNGVECNRLQLQFEAQDEQAGSSPKTTENCTVALPLDTKVEQEEKPEGPPAEGNDGLLSKNVERDGFGNTELCSHIP